MDLVTDPDEGHPQKKMELFRSLSCGLGVPKSQGVQPLWPQGQEQRDLLLTW
jgi:hypothetical protein